MSILGKYIETEDEQDLNYKIPAVFKHNPKEMSLTKSVLVSTAIHPLAVFLVWLFIFIAGLLGISFVIFNKPEAKPKDIEFVLVDKEQTPINKNTRFRADKNSRAGGKHDPKRKVSMPKAGGSGAVKQKPLPKAAKPAAPQNVQPKKKVEQPKKSLFGNKSKTEPAPARVQAPTPAPRPGIQPSAPKITDKPKSNFTIPVPKTNIPHIGTPMGTGPIASPTGTGTGGSKVGGTGSGTGTGLNFAPTNGTGSGTAGKRTSGTGSGYGTGTGNGTGRGNLGNPGPGNPNGRPGIDAIREPDFGPYMRDLQQRIKRNWDPPKGEESRRVVLLFTIARDGRLLGVRVSKSSGLQSADKAALSAVQLTAPFRPLPAEYKESSVDIQFTFDYNVFGAKKYN